MAAATNGAMTAPCTTRSIRLERAQRVRWWGRQIKIPGISFTVLVLVPCGVAGVYMNPYWPLSIGTLVAVGL